MRKKNLFIKIIAILILSFQQVNAEDTTKYDYGNEYFYSEPDLFDFVTNTPSNFVNFFDFTFRKDNFPFISTLVIITHIMERYDEELNRETHKFAMNNEISKKYERGSANREILDGYLKIPKNLNSWLLQLGNPLFHAGIGLSLAFYGNDKIYGPRPLQTSSQIFEALILDTLLIEVLSRTITREKPFVSDETSENWHFSFSKGYGEDYFKFTSFPASNIAYFTSTATILATNYFEETYIGTISYMLGALLIFSSMNADLHWGSDFPIGIAIGYASAKSVMKKNLKKDEDIYKYKPYYEINPMQFPDGGVGIVMNYKF